MLLLFEVSVKQAFECTAVASFILSHFVNCIVDCIIAKLLRSCSKLFRENACNN